MWDYEPCNHSAEFTFTADAETLRKAPGRSKPESAERAEVAEQAGASHGSCALQRELNVPRKNGVSGEALLKNLARLYSQHNLRDWLDRMNAQPNQEDYPRIVCSEALVQQTATLDAAFLREPGWQLGTLEEVT